MSTMNVPVEALAARKARYQLEVANLDYRRNIVLMRNDGLTQKAIAEMIGVTQPTVQKILARAATVSMPTEGFAGADPYEICERFAAGLIGREQLLDELTRWDYVPRDRTSGVLDDLIIEVPGSLDDLERALRRELIDDDLFDEVADRIEARLNDA